MISFTQDHQEEKIEDLNKIRSEGGEIIYDTTEIQKNHKKMLLIVIYQQIGNLEEGNKFLETDSLPRLNPEETIWKGWLLVVKLNL